MPKLSLYTYWRSSSAFRVRIALGYKGLDYEPVFVNLLEGQQRATEYKVEMNPMGYVPCLVVDGVKFVESSAIIELLEDLAPEPALFPKSPADRARVRALVQYINAGTQPLQNLAVLEKLGADAAKRKEWIRHFIGHGLTAFEALATGYAAEAGHRGPFVFGEGFSAADVFLLPQLYNARRYHVDVSSYPTILRAEAAANELAFVRAAHPDAQPDAQLDAKP
jgi:maleylacetoacetate isomerase